MCLDIGLNFPYLSSLELSATVISCGVVLKQSLHTVPKYRVKGFYFRSRKLVVKGLRRE